MFKFIKFCVVAYLSSIALIFAAVLTVNLAFG
jgi:hypothetical protein